MPSTQARPGRPPPGRASDFSTARQIPAAAISRKRRARSGRGFRRRGGPAPPSGRGAREIPSWAWRCTRENKASRSWQRRKRKAAPPRSWKTAGNGAEARRPSHPFDRRYEPRGAPGSQHAEALRSAFLILCLCGLPARDTCSPSQSGLEARHTISLRSVLRQNGTPTMKTNLRRLH